MKKRMNKRSVRCFRRNKDGAMAVEFALILPVFLVVLFGTMEVGNILYAKNTLQQGIETAGRYAMVHIDAPTTEIRDYAMANITELGGLSPTFTVVAGTISGVASVTISVRAQYSIITPFFTGRTINLTSSMSVPQTDPSEYS